MTVIDRYLFKEISLSFIATLLVLTLVIVGNIFVRLLSQASAGELPVDVLTKLLLFGSFRNLITLIPIALLIGMMLAFSRLYRDAEMIAFRAAGVSPKRFYKAIFSFITPLTILMILLIFFVSPWIEKQNLQIQREINERPEASGIPPGIFVTTGSSKGRYTILAEKIDENKTTMQRFFVHAKSEGKEQVIWGKSAILFIDSVGGSRVLQINHGNRYENNDNNNTLSMTYFVEHGIRIPLLGRDLGEKISTLSMTELIAGNTNEHIAEIHWRLAIILSAPLLALLALPLSHTRPRQGRYGRIAWGILIYAIYANLLMTGEDLLKKGDVPSWLGLWWVHLLLLIFIAVLLRVKFGKVS